MGCVDNTTPPPLYTRERELVRYIIGRPDWKGAENLAPTGIKSILEYVL
jgi:hypothetical protein